MTETTASATRLFVYGTLMRGQAAASLMTDGVFVESAVTEPRFSLVDLGEYPALADYGDHAIHGEVYLVNSALLLRLDEYEGDQYARRAINLRGSKPASAYIWRVANFSGMPLIGGGDWRKR